jgi:hypothetical protein
MKTAIYTINHHGYDDVKPIDAPCDCLLFTDNPELSVKGWRTIVTQHSQRQLKIFPWHEGIMNKYDNLIYMDANLEMRDGAYEYILEQLKLNDFITTKHPTRDCVYEEIDACMQLGKDKVANLETAFNRLSQFAMPKHTGVISSAFIARKNLPSVKKYSLHWAINHRIVGTRRDQISQAYTQWTKPLDMELLNYSFTFRQLFTLHKHAKKQWT